MELKPISKKTIEEAMKKVGPTKAGEGESPYSQEFLDESNGKRKKSE